MLGEKIGANVAKPLWLVKIGAAPIVANHCGYRFSGGDAGATQRANISATALSMRRPRGR
eukprot:10609803-Lingulodinium_polyedra.AAC.1